MQATKQLIKREKRRGKARRGILADRPDVHPLSDFKMFSSPGVGLPATRRVTLRYAEIFRVTSTAGAVGKFLFAANGMYDPNLTGAGHQPYGFDQWFTLYKTAMVVRSRIDIQVASAAASPMQVGVTFAESDPTVVTGTATPVALMEASRGTTQILNSYVPAIHLQSTFDLATSYPEFDPGDVQQVGSSNPTRTFVFCVYQVPTDFTSTLIGDYSAVIEYEAIFSQPLTVAAS